MASPNTDVRGTYLVGGVCGVCGVADRLGAVFVVVDVHGFEAVRNPSKRALNESWGGGARGR
jgi:hypothetical protein